MDVTWVEIDLGALRHNISQIRKRIGRKVKICAVVKDNAYGHGLLPVSQVAVEEGVDYLGVADISDGIRLRTNKVNVPILNLVPNLPGDIKHAVKYDIIQCLSNSSLLRLLNEESRRQNKISKVHIEVDTGMGRAGLFPESFKAFYDGISNLRNVKLDGIFTHLACSDGDREYTLRQIKLFKKVIMPVPSGPIIHCANSSGVISYPESHFDMVRPGLMIYGLTYTKKEQDKINLKPVLSWKTRVVLIREIKRRTPISYGATYRTAGDTRIAVLAIGYGDGYNRMLSNRGKVIIGGKKYDVCGRVCMDMTMVDIGNEASVKVGDEVILIGKSNNQQIRVEDIAKICRTVPNEIVCAINKDLKREFN